MRWNGSLRAGLMALLLWVVAGDAAAQDDPDTVRARALFQEGIDLADARRFTEAAAKFREARALRDAPAIRLNLALCLHELDEDAEATALARSVIDDPESPPEVRTQAETLAATLQSEAASAPPPEEPTPAPAPATEPAPIEGGDDDGDRSLVRDWRLWAGVGAGVVLIVLIAVIAATAGGGGGVVQGDFEPAVLRW